MFSRFRKETQPQAPLPQNGATEAGLPANAIPCVSQNVADGVAPPPTQPPRPPIDSSAVRKAVLTGLNHYGPVLLAMRTVLLIGAQRDPSVDISIQGPLRARHAVLICDEAPDKSTESKGDPRFGVPRVAEMQWSILPLAGAAVSVNEQQAVSGGLQPLADGDRLQLGRGRSAWRFRHPDRRDSTAVLEQSEASPTAARIDESTTAATIVIGRGVLVIGRDPRRSHLVQRSLPCEQLRIWQDRCGWIASSEERESCVFVNDDALCEHVSPPQSLPLHVQISPDGPQLIERALIGINAPLEVHLQLTELV